MCKKEAHLCFLRDLRWLRLPRRHRGPGRRDERRRQRVKRSHHEAAGEDDRGGGGDDRLTAGHPGQAARPGSGAGLRAVRRDDAAERVLLHVLQLREQHRLRLIATAV